MVASDYDIILLTETWLHNGVNVAETQYPGRVTFRRDRSDSTNSRSRGGGLILSIDAKLNPTCGDIPDDLLTEAVAGTFLFGNVSILLVGIYAPPYSRDTVVSDVSSILDRVLESSGCDASILLGDFNCSGIGWVSDDETARLLPETNVPYGDNCALVNNILARGLSQINDIPNSLNNWLDLIFTSPELDASMMSLSEIHSLDRHSLNHYPQLVKIGVSQYNVSHSPPKFRRNYHKINSRIFNDTLARKLVTAPGDPTNEAEIDKLSSIIFEAYDTALFDSCPLEVD